jgi:hypothetical protein
MALRLTTTRSAASAMRAVAERGARFTAVRAFSITPSCREKLPEADVSSFPNLRVRH